MDFVHLRTHTEYSVVDGTIHIDDLVAASSADGQAALAVTDLSNLFGAVKFYSAARKGGVKPIIGCDVWVEPEGGDKEPSRLLLLVQTKTGYLNLCNIISRSWVDNVHGERAFVKWDWLAELGEGLIVFSGARDGAVGRALVAGDIERGRFLAQQLAAQFPNRFYLELQRAGHPDDEPHVRAATRLASDLRLPVVATHPVQFMTPDDFDAHEARVCIADGETIESPKRIRRFTTHQYLKTRAEMTALFKDIPSALQNTVEVGKRCSLSLVLGKPQLPDFPTPFVDGARIPVDDYFRQQCIDGLNFRMAQLYPDEGERAKQRPRYNERLDFEIQTILKMGFTGYFLIVADFINWAKANDCPVGPGRGSGAGSLVAFSLNITGLDPLRYNLLFERFLNPDRVSMPDFDIDFCQTNRERVIDYVKEKFGRESVSQIATFGTMAAKGALRDVGRVLGMGYGQVDAISRLIPSPPGKAVSLKQVPETPDAGVVYVRKEVPELEEMARKQEKVGELLALAERVEGTVRNIGTHAGGVVIAPGRITDFCPLYQQPGSTSAVSQFDKDDVESIGLVKFDFLGLATLTILEQAKNHIRARRAGQKDFDFETLPLDDKASYRLMSEGKTVAVFQLESAGMQRMLRDAKPSVFEDVIALVALYRPGPMDLIPTFCARKHGREVVQYPHPLMEGVLKETYGIMVYQEQVMQVAQIVGGYSLGAADLLRRAMGKKKLEEMVAQRTIFAAGAAKNNIDDHQANEIFDLMEKFAGYGFNKSHAAAYALLAYHTAYLKVHYLAEFTAANMTVMQDEAEKLKIIYDDALSLGIAFEAPNVNTNGYRFAPASDSVVRYGLGAIKGIGQGAIEALVRARDEGGPFTSMFDLCNRVGRGNINKTAVEALIKSGAFDTLHPSRSAMMASVGRAMDYATTQVANVSQGGLFEFDGSDSKSSQEPALAAVDAWTTNERLGFEKAALGICLSGHLFDQNEDEVRLIARRRNADIVDSREPQLVAGIISDLRIINGQRGRVALFKLDDKSAIIDAAAAEEVLLANREQLKDGQLVVLQVKVQPDKFSGGLRLNVLQAWDLAAARCRFGKFLRVEAAGSVPPVAEVLRDFPARQINTGDGDVTQGLTIHLQLQSASASAEIDLGESARFYPTDEALARWKAGSSRVSVVYEGAREMTLAPPQAERRRQTP